MGRLMITLLVLCLISVTTCSLSTRTAAFRAHDHRRGLKQAAHGHLLVDATEGGAVVPIHWSKAHYVANFTIGTPPQPAARVGDDRHLRGARLDAVLTVPQLLQAVPAPVRPERVIHLPAGVVRHRRLCKSIPTSNCSSHVCIYEGTTLTKLVCTDTFAIGTATASLAFGRVVASDMDTIDGPSGFLGLGRTPPSLVVQMNIAKFSYCLSPRHTRKSSRLFLGSSAKLAGGIMIISNSGESTSTTPFIKTSPNDDSRRYYLLSLEAIKASNTTIATAQSGDTLVMHTVSPVSLLVDSA
uniref:Xylanase inhibitor N-terminal domain-containing protein n=1 Tax=Oryza punctata TaxID=4537 RepID=A0A0E0JHQ2_ORYPU